MKKFYTLLEFNSILQVSSIKMKQKLKGFIWRNTSINLYNLCILYFTDEETETHKFK